MRKQSVSKITNNVRDCFIPLNGIRKDTTGLMSMIKLRNIHKIFPEGFWGRKVTALEDLTLNVHSGEILGYLGPNGAGKTTTIKIIVGLIRQTRGEAKIMGLPASDERARKQLGYLPEQPYFYHYLTGWEFLMYCGSLSGISRKQCRKSAGELLERLEMEEHAKKYLRNYSRGMLQRIGFAQALLHDPQLIILDEPMEGLDPLGRRTVKDIIIELRSQGKTVFFSSHILEEVEAICDRGAIINKGKLVQADTIESILSKHVKTIEVQALINEKAAAEKLAEQFNCIIQRQDNRLSFTVAKDDELYPILDAVRQNSGKIISILPHRATLEEIFIEQISHS